MYNEKISWIRRQRSYLTIIFFIFLIVGVMKFFTDPKGSIIYFILSVSAFVFVVFIPQEKNK